MAGVNISLAMMPVAVLFSAVISGLVIWAISGIRSDTVVDEKNPGSFRHVFRLKDGRNLSQSNIISGHEKLETWDDIRSWLGGRFDHLPLQISDVSMGKSETYHSVIPGDQALVSIKRSQNGHTVVLEDTAPTNALDRHTMLVEQERAATLRNVLQHAPAIVFELTANHEVRWGNSQFDALSEEEKSILEKAAENSEPLQEESVCTESADTKSKRHFDVTSNVVGDNTKIVYASEVTRLVEADSMRSNFIQTLTKTFADLSTGLAVFDKDQKLVLFNPAIPDLTNLSVEFLSARPPMVEFFDHLRDKQIMPEPKNYATWREQITDMIRSAADGTYCESWCLPGGSTYKLTGRPHPNGAIAFLLEDITNEMMLTRQSRSQTETYQAILDAMDGSVAVIGQDGDLLISNAAFVDILGFDPDVRFTPTSLKEVIKAFERRFPGHSKLQQLTRGGFVAPVEIELERESTGALKLRVQSLPDGLLLLSILASSAPEILSA